MFLPALDWRLGLGRDIPKVVVMSGLGFVLFFLLLSLLLVAMNAYALRWASSAFSLSQRVRRGLGVVLFGSLLAMVIARIVDRGGWGVPVSGVLVVASSVQLMVIVSTVFLLLADAALFVRTLMKRALRRRAQEKAPPVVVPELPRRTFLAQAAAGSAFMIGSSSTLYGVLSGRHDYVIEEVALEIPGLARGLDGFSIVQLSDVHIGPFVGAPELAAAEDLVAKARPDLIVLTGDLLDHDARLADQLGRFARRLGPLARHGVVAITGNHDFYAGVDATVSALARAGTTVLRNRGIVVGDSGAGFALLGVDDIWAGRRVPGAGPNLERAVQTLPQIAGSVAKARDLPRILLCHNPSYFERAAGEVELQLSGHTHGGQVNLVVRPGELFVKNGWLAGLYERSGSRLYINRGFGTVGPPARIGAPPEITRIVLTA